MTKAKKYLKEALKIFDSGILTPEERFFIFKIKYYSVQQLEKLDSGLFNFLKRIAEKSTNN